MFGFNYKVVPVNEAKNIYKLTPTTGTLLKAFAPSLALGAVFGALVVIGNLMTDDDSIDLTQTINDTLDES